MIVVFADEILMSGDSNGLLDLVLKYFKVSFEVRIRPKKTIGFLDYPSRIVGSHLSHTMRCQSGDC